MYSKPIIHFGDYIPQKMNEQIHTDDCRNYKNNQGCNAQLFHIITLLPETLIHLLNRFGTVPAHAYPQVCSFHGSCPLRVSTQLHLWVLPGSSVMGPLV